VVRNLATLDPISNRQGLLFSSLYTDVDFLFGNSHKIYLPHVSKNLSACNFYYLIFVSHFTAAVKVPTAHDVVCCLVDSDMRRSLCERKYLAHNLMHSLPCHSHHHKHAYAADYQGERKVSNIFCITQNELHRAIHKQVFTVQAPACKNVDDFDKTVTLTG